MTRELTVSIDAMGGDAGPGVVVAALARAVLRHPDREISSAWRRSSAETALRQTRQASRTASSIRHAAERVRMEEKPSQALRRGRNTSMWRAIESVKNDEAEVVDLGRQHGRADGDVDVPAAA